jgi:RNA polymerase sigma-70 factor (ECF subfamily)
MAEPQTFERLYEEHVGSVFAFCSSRVGRQRAEDLTADVFCRALGAWSRFEDRGTSPKAWLMQIAYHRIVEEWRGSRRVEPGDVETLVDRVTGEDRSLEELVAQRDQIAQVMPELGELPEHQRTVLAMRYLGELSVAETAAAVGTTEEAVRAATMRGLRTLRRRLAPLAEV